MLDSTEDEVEANTVHQLEKDKIICGYHTLVDWNKVNDEDVTAVVELRVTPQGGDGYERIAEKIKDFPQVETLYLMSGTYDFGFMIKGTTLKKSLFLCPAIWLPWKKQHHHTFCIDKIQGIGSILRHTEVR